VQAVVTHGLSVECTDEQDAYRKVGIQRLSNDEYVLYLETRWPDQLEPVCTVVSLSVVALAMLAKVSHEASENMDDYAAPEA